MTIFITNRFVGREFITYVIVATCVKITKLKIINIKLKLKYKIKNYKY